MRWMMLWLVASVAWAQDEVDPETGRPIRFQDRTDLIFEEPVRLEGQLVGPGIIANVEMKRFCFGPMIRLRESFAPELKASVALAW